MDTTLARPPIGQVLDGRYRVESLVARGGMATVYLGTDTRLDRTVALKIMHAEYANDEDFVRRFVGEARSVARLSHPNVVTVFDQGADGRTLYLAMEYIAGRTLRDVLRERGRLSAREALDIMGGVLSGLGAAHQAGLAHRDVKPENVLIADRTVKVADFGLARVLTDASHTKSGVIIGTAAYLAPEQVSGGTADARTDVYASGIMLFELVTGSQPHTGESPLAVAYKHVNEVVPPPSSLVRDLPPALDALVALATSRDPDLRPADAGQLLRALAGVRQTLQAPGYPAPGVQVPGYPAPGAQVPGYPAAPPGALPPDSASLPTPPRGVAGAQGGWPQQPPVRSVPDFIPGMAPAPQPYGAPPDVPPGATQQFQQGGHHDGVHKTLIVSGGGHGTYDPPPGGYGTPPREPRLQRLLFSRRLAYLAAAVVAVVIIGVAAWWQTTGRYTSVPRVNGMTLAAARTELRHLGFGVAMGSARLDNRVSKGQVIESIPAAGAQVVKGGRVTLVVSEGPHVETVPQVSGKTVAAAKDALRKVGLAPGPVKTEPSATVPAGIVISTQPTAGRSWPQPRPVTLLVSAGPPLPNFVGQQKAVAEQWSAQQGASLNEVTNAKSTQPAGTIISQSPSSGSIYTKGEVITITISAGPRMVGIPNVDGMQVQNAQAALKQLGFQVRVVTQGPIQRVFSYSPNGQAPQGSTITLYVGLPGLGGNGNGNGG